jgi:predicted GIY-YIG superfamily endonuclease
MIDSGIYIITCTANAKVYIGSSKNMKKRMWNHKTYLVTNRHSNEHLQLAWNKYGDKAFTFNRLERMETKDRIELERRELYWIQRYEATDREKGFNKCLPGEISQKILDNLKKKNVNKQWGVYSINLKTGRRVYFRSTNLASISLGFAYKTVQRCMSYWKDGVKNCTRSHKGYLFVREADYREAFDYVAYMKPRKKRTKGLKYKKK